MGIRTKTLTMISLIIKIWVTGSKNDHSNSAEAGHHRDATNGTNDCRDCREVAGDKSARGYVEEEYEFENVEPRLPPILTDASCYSPGIEVKALLDFAGFGRASRKAETPKGE